ncbi:hypothetical protein ACWV26_08045 [Rummeliibacillus sp. JY-2-4R]
MIKVCEVCGYEENMEIGENEQSGTRMLHICENCRTDRNISYFDDEEFQ